MAQLLSLRIHGYRGFRTPQEVLFAVPNNQAGSGFTVITGPNNSGKSTILEALRARVGRHETRFAQGARNQATDLVEITYCFDDHEETLRSLRKGAAQTSSSDNHDPSAPILVLPSRRAFQSHFSPYPLLQEDFIRATRLPLKRGVMMDEIAQRLIDIDKSPDEFNAVLAWVLKDDDFDWTIDTTDEGNTYIKIRRGPDAHSTEGAGEGLVNIMSILATLVPAPEGSLVAIDEPELSLHPSLQKRLAQLLLEFAATKQVVIATHSPYFLDASSLRVGGEWVRVRNHGNSGSEVFQLTQHTRAILAGLAAGSINNPHLFGLDAREVFFQDDGVILVEGQEDVVLLPKVAAELGDTIRGNVFGWGVGGAGNMKHVCTILHELGFQRVAAVLDGDKATEIPKLQESFPDYCFVALPAADIRTKAPTNSPGKEGLLARDGTIRDDHVAAARLMLESVNEYLTGQSPQPSQHPRGNN